MSRHLIATALALALLPGLAAAEKVTVYKSTGANGETVYSQTQISGSESVTVDSSSAEAQAALAEQPKTEVQVACERARKNLELLASDNRLQRDKDGDGQPEDLTPEERLAEKELAERQVAAYCEPATDD